MRYDQLWENTIQFLPLHHKFHSTSFDMKKAAVALPSSIFLKVRYNKIHQDMRAELGSKNLVLENGRYNEIKIQRYNVNY